MSRVITFSMKFPAYHPKAGKPTNFVEKLCNAFMEIDSPILEIDELDLVHGPWDGLGKKWHTIRAGHRWQAGDTFSPRVWSGKPYNSKQVIIAPDIEVKKVWKVEIANNTLLLDRKELSHSQWFELAKNDGLKVDEMLNWFRYPHEFSGQIICWNPDLEY